MSMIRIGDVATNGNNVLDQTRFQQITDPLNMTFRARRIGDVGFQTGDKAVLKIGSIEVSTVVINQQDTSQGTSVVDGDFRPLGLSADDVIWSGRVDPGSLLLTFPNAATANSNVLWDVTATG